MTWIFFLQLIRSFNNMGIGRERIATSITISTAARIHENKLILMHVPVVSPAQPCQKKGIGVHWKIMVKVLAMPKPTETPMSVKTTRRKVRWEEKTRR